MSEVNTVWAWGWTTKHFSKKEVPSGIRTHDLPHDSLRPYPLRHKSLYEVAHGIFLILS